MKLKKRAVLIMESEGVYKIVEEDSEDKAGKIRDYLKSMRDLEEKK